jgi:hypothetical protein
MTDTNNKDQTPITNPTTDPVVKDHNTNQNSVQPPDTVRDTNENHPPYSVTDQDRNAGKG